MFHKAFFVLSFGVMMGGCPEIWAGALAATQVMPRGVLWENIIAKSGYLADFDRITHIGAYLKEPPFSFEALFERLHTSVRLYQKYLKEAHNYAPDRFNNFQVYLGLALNQWLGPDTYKQFSHWAASSLREQGRKIPRYLMIIPPERSSKHRFERRRLP